MNNDLPLVVKAQPCGCSCDDGFHFSEKGVERERSQRDEREKALKERHYLIGVLNAGEWLCGGLYGIDQPSMGVDLVKNLTAGIPKKKLIEVAREEGLIHILKELGLSKQ